MIDKIGHYALTNPASVYDEEALTALELAGRTAAKVNDCIVQVNKNTEEVDRLPEYVQDNLDAMNKDGTLRHMALDAVASGKVDKGGLEQVTPEMLSQDVKTMMTGGSVAVVGEGAVNTSNLVDGSVTQAKLAKNLRQLVMHGGAADYNRPILLINTVNPSVQINTTANTAQLYGVEGRVNLVPANCVIDATAWTGSEAFSVYFDNDTNVIYVTDYSGVTDTLRACYLLGKTNLGHQINTLCIPVEINGVLYNGSTHINPVNLPALVKPTHIAMNRYAGMASAVVFDVDPDTLTFAIVNGGSYNIYQGHRFDTLDFDNVNFDTSGVSAGFTRAYLYYSPDDLTIFVQASMANVPAHYVYLGMMLTDNVQNSSLIVPFSVGGTYIYSPHGNRRSPATVLYYPQHYYGKTLPYVDYKNLRLVFPSVNYLYLLCGDTFYNISKSQLPDAYSGDDYVVPLLSGYNFLVGGETGIKAVDNNTYKSIAEGANREHYYMIGALHTNARHASLSFDFIDGAGSLSVLGDSISALDGYIPDGNTAYYKDERPETMWWSQVMRRCGLYRNTINAHSGRCVTTGINADNNGVTAASALDNGSAPDNVIVYLGTNDFRRGIALGSYDGRGAIPTDGSTFREAYAMMLNNIITTYPKAKIFACTLMAQERNSGNTGPLECNTAGVYLFEYNEAIREIATRFHAEVIDLASCGIHYANGSEYMNDYGSTYTGSFTHPNTKGHKMIGAKASQAVLMGRRYNL